jgi:hypothetical protein
MSSGIGEISGSPERAILRASISPVREMKAPPRGVSVRAVKRFPKGETLDRIVAAGLVVLGELELWIGDAVPGPKGVAAVLMVAITAPIAVRRRWPLGAGTAVLAATTAQGLVGGYGSSLAQGLAWMCALYAIAVWTDTRRFLAGVGVLVLGNVLSLLQPGKADLEAAAIFTWAPILAMVLVRGAVRGRELRADALCRTPRSPNASWSATAPSRRMSRTCCPSSASATACTQ